MTTVLTDSPEEAASYLRRGQTVAFPTETVYGLGADAFNPDAVRLIFEAKGRPPDNPLIVHVATREQIDEVVASRSAAANRLIEGFFPGPLTVILPKSYAVPPEVTAGLETVAVRMPDHPVAQAFLRACGRPVAAPSANRSGRPSPTTWEAVRDDLDGRIGCILRGERAPLGLESTVVDCTVDPPVVLRAGAVSVEDLLEAVGELAFSPARGERPTRSPGLKHRHYAPSAKVIIVDHPPDELHEQEAYIGMEEPENPFLHQRICSSVDEYAYELFDFFRQCDAVGIRTIYCQKVREEGLGVALMDRLRRA